MLGCSILSRCWLMFCVYRFGQFLLLYFPFLLFFLLQRLICQSHLIYLTFCNRYLYPSLPKFSLGLYVFHFFPHHVLSSSFLSTWRISMVEILISSFTIVCVIFRSVSIVWLFFQCGLFFFFLPLGMPVNFLLKARHSEYYVAGCAWHFCIPLNKFWTVFSEAVPIIWNGLDPLEACSPVLLGQVQNSLWPTARMVPLPRLTPSGDSTNVLLGVFSTWARGNMNYFWLSVSSGGYATYFFQLVLSLPLWFPHKSTDQYSIEDSRGSFCKSGVFFTL